MADLKKQFISEIIPQIKQEFSLANDFQVPRLEKIVVNMGLGRALQDAKVHEIASAALAKITGQKAIKTKAHASVAGFKLRKGAFIGQKVTLRGKRMYDFFEKMIKIALPRTRDFRGLPQSAQDQSGNLNIGFSEHTVFPEIEPLEISSPLPLSVTVVMKPRNREVARRVLEKFGVPFKKE